MNLKNFLLVSLLVLGSGCTHVHTVKGFNAPTADLQNAKDKKVAVIFGADRFQKDVTIEADGHTFIFKDNDGFYRQAYGSALDGAVAQVDFHVVEPGQGYDVYLYPGLTMKMTQAFLTKTCVVQYSLLAKDASGTELTSQTLEKSRGFQVIANAGNACKIAMLEAFDAVTYPVMKSIDP